MKKIMIVGGVVYTVICIGACVYMVVNPEGYGRYMGKVFKGFFNEVDDEQEVIK